MKNIQLVYIILVCLFAPGFASGQMKMDTHYVSEARSSIPLLRNLLAIPNDAHHLQDILINVAWCEREFGNRGFTTNRLETPGAPLLLAERIIDPAEKSVLVYLQVDGQPVDSSFWYQSNPYQAVLKEQSREGGWEEISWDHMERGFDEDWRIFARSTSDSKGAVVMFLTAIDKMIRNQEWCHFNLKVIMDFEEELGSPNLPDAVKQHRDILSADQLIIFDGPMHLINEPTLTFGARGISTITLKVFGPLFPQHSGHYGNYVPNPALRLSQLLAGMKNEQGVVTLAGFYDGIEISSGVREILKNVPDDEQVIKAKMGISKSDAVADTYQESIQYPSLNIRGLQSGWVGDEVRTIVPASATAEIDIRTVLESDPDHLIHLVREYIVTQGYHITSGAPTREERILHDRICSFEATTSYRAYRTEFDTPVGRWLDRALTKAYGYGPIKQRTSGGSIPISPFVVELGIPAVTVPTVNRDNNQHSPNENIRLGNYVNGIKTIYSILTEPLVD